MKGNTLPSELNKFQILITSYEVFSLDFNDVIVNVPFQFIIVDEAHRLKNKNAKILSTLKRLPCKRVLLLTGTPIQNNTGELWSLLNYIHPEKFLSYDDFRRNFGDLSSQEQVERLNKVLKPYMLRRMKEDVEQSIPPLQETIIDVEMTNIQKTIYRALYEKNKNMLIKGLASSSSYNTNLNNLEIQLRKCCNHPFLIKEI
jgi:chromodomain-helicase-DNA-binding protein 7